MLDSLVAELLEEGLILNADKTVILTSQPPSTVTTDHGITLIILSGNSLNSHSMPSESAELLRSPRDMGKEFNIQTSWLQTKLYKSLDNH